MRNAITTILVLAAAVYGALPDFFHSPWDDLGVVMTAATLAALVTGRPKL
jgi:hypothetical protein